MKNQFIKLSFMLLAFLLMLSCENDDFTNNSIQSATSPSLTVSLGFGDTETTLLEEEKEYDFTVTISEAQIVNVVVYLEQTDGTATDGLDFTIPHSITIPKGKLSASDVIKIHRDEVTEEVETATILIGTGNEANVNEVTGQTVTFNISNYTEGDLIMDLEWAAATKVYDHAGEEYDSTFFNLDLDILDGTKTSVIKSETADKFENLEMLSTLPDGEYSIIHRFSNTQRFPSDFPNVEINSKIIFNQVGKINDKSFNFDAVFDTKSSCEDDYYTLVKIIKTGENYEIEEVGEKTFASSDASFYIGEATVIADAWADYKAGEKITIENGANANQFFIRATGNAAITNAATAYMIVDIDPLTDEATVTTNEDFVYKGQTTTTTCVITGKGSVIPCTSEINLVLDYKYGADDYSGLEFKLKL